MKLARTRALYALIAVVMMVAIDGPSLVPPPAAAQGGLVGDPTPELDPAAFPPDEHPSAGGAGAARAAVAAAIAGQGTPRPDAPAAAAPSTVAAGAAADTSATVDFMVVYTPAGAADAGGAASVSAQ